MAFFRKPLAFGLLILVALLAWGTTAQAQQPDAITRFALALMTRDSQTLQTILADNYLHINANGYLQDKEHFIANIKSGSMVIDRLTFFDIVETKYGNTIVVTSNTLFKGKFKPKLPEGLQRVTIVSHGENTKERIVLYQATPVLDRKERSAAEKEKGKDAEKDKE